MSMQEINLYDEPNKEFIRLGALYLSGDSMIRTIYCSKDITIHIDIRSFIIVKESTEDFFCKITNKEYIFSEEKENFHIKVSQKEMEIAEQRKMHIENMLMETFPDWDKLFQRASAKPHKERARTSIGISKEAFRRLLKRYLVSGRSIYSLIDQRHYNKGRPINVVMTVDSSEAEDGVNDIEIQMRFALQVFKKTGNVQTAYDEVLKRYYMDYVETEDGVERRLREDRPSYKKIYNYISENLGGKSVTQFRMGESNYENNCRLLPGNAQYGVTSIGQLYEMDEVELGCYLVSEQDPSQVIGKAILYVCVDVKANIIVAAKVGLKNNSYAGYCDCMLTLLEPHSVQASLVGAECDDDIFPSMVMPNEIRCDHGSEYESKMLEAACYEMGIKVSFVRTASGSKKGLVESFHHRLQQHLKKMLGDAGYIVTIPGVKPTQDVYDTARETACLTLSDISKIVYEEVMFFNQAPLKKFDADADMIRAGLILTPANIYRFETERSMDPTNVTPSNKQQYIFAMLNRCGVRRFSINREGICYQGHSLKYFSEEEWFIAMLNSSDCKDAEIRYMDSCVDCLWVCYHKEIHKVPLAVKRENLASFQGMSWTEYDTIYEPFKKNNKQEQDRSTERKAELEDRISQTVSYAKILQGEAENNTTDIREAREIEKRFQDTNPDNERNRLVIQDLSEAEQENKKELLEMPSEIDILVEKAVPDEFSTERRSPGKMSMERLARLTALGKD